MRSILAVAAVIGLSDRCSDDPVHWPVDPSHPSPHAQAGAQAQAGSQAHAGAPAQPELDAGVDAERPHAAGAPAQPARAGAQAGPVVQTPEPCIGPPGLYADRECRTLAEGVEVYEPKYELWSDDTLKQRHIYLPPETSIDTSDPDHWAFPVGTRLYKTFAWGSLKLETRVLEKRDAAAGVDSWSMVAYAWSEDQRSVTPADPNGVANVLGTTHDIPSQAQCRSCHALQGADVVNGFGALQLNHERESNGWTLQRLIAAGRLVNLASPAANVTPETARLPGDATAQAALGYLHANCGHCHGGANPRAGLGLWSPIGLTDVAQTPVFKGGVCQCLTRWTGRTASDGTLYTQRIAAGDAAHSGLVARMNARGPGEQMPTLGTELVDMEGVAAVSAWIDSLDVTACVEAPACAGPAAP